MRWLPLLIALLILAALAARFIPFPGPTSY